MCGIVVMQGAQGEVQMQEMLNRIKHRGPDGSGILQMGESVLGHVRLSILDVQGGAQPMTNEKGDLALSFNGEIYNYLNFRQKLENRHKFQTRSDSEVLLHLYEEEHEDMLSQLDGMFAIALASSRGLLLARDPIGIKPLYYGKRGDLFIAASELKAFPEMDDIKMLPAGYAMYAGEAPWQFSKPFPPHNPLIAPSIEDVLKEIRRRLDVAVEKRLMSDVPVGVYLSGGLDSSLVAALMRPHTVNLHSFTAGMEGAPDLESARTVAKFLDTEHHELIYTAKDVEKAIPEVIRALESFDAPLVRSAVPMYFVSKLAAKYVKVVLSGEGADELFAGYSYLGKIKDRNRLRQELSDITLRLQDTNLQRADRVSMTHGLEARVPFLDMDLVRYVSRMPVEFLEQRSDRPEKWLLREACRGLLPPKILDRKKMKFSEGAGSSEVIAELVKNKIDQQMFENEKEVEPGLILRSPEELYYYRIWRNVMEPHITSDLVGRTLDRSAANGS
ncbi:MAG: asparagine synthase B [Chloroflexi bacterium HGW-Chloroflexi-4]|jgi:asparagine synthase (glutamine-hydrolysing)|nr:MAG: asparagine synthase B [Chloroflexi bacterium HGW-Chloroflexi-4]